MDMGTIVPGTTYCLWRGDLQGTQWMVGVEGYVYVAIGLGYG